MPMLIAKNINGINYNVQRKTVREIYDLFDRAVRRSEDDKSIDPETPDWIGNTLFDEMTIHDLIAFTDLKREQIMDIYPVDIEKIISEVKQENPHFFVTCRKLEEAGKRLDAVLKNTTSNNSKPAFLP